MLFHFYQGYKLMCQSTLKVFLSLRQCQCYICFYFVLQCIVLLAWMGLEVRGDCISCLDGDGSEGGLYYLFGWGWGVRGDCITWMGLGGEGGLYYLLGWGWGVRGIVVDFTCMNVLGSFDL